MEINILIAKAIKFILLFNFMLFPLWILLFFAGYLLKLKGIKKTECLMPGSLMLSQLALLYFYHETHNIYFFYKYPTTYDFSISNPFLTIAAVNLLLIFIIMFIKNQKKHHFYFIPLIGICSWILLYLYY